MHDRRLSVAFRTGAVTLPLTCHYYALSHGFIEGEKNNLLQKCGLNEHCENILPICVRGSKKMLWLEISRGVQLMEARQILSEFDGSKASSFPGLY